ncbi:hypothetical protein SAMN05216198_3558 [Halopseudomonas litoralis]|uniref:Uncharacterized protein n=1 Tax=Halopseudomonas litoralis TaxID=797277 RepID=A0A1H1XAH9_9GAMM|nr:hypothetical protein [Halopseudomonas litoralis]SDT06328.1 hypothetical protein SAMN05216198_3558 [Halopseudomonas litoralis]
MLLDNKTSGHVGNELKKYFSDEAKLSVLSSLFTLYGFASLKQELKKLQSAKLLLTEWEVPTLQTLIGSEGEVRLLNQLQQKRIAAEFSQWLTDKASVKASLFRQPGQNIFHLDSGDESFAVHGSATFSPTGLGEVRSRFRRTVKPIFMLCRLQTERMRYI